MKCPQCQSTALETTNSRKSLKTNTTRRRKECKACFCRFTTTESISVFNKKSKEKTYSINIVKEVVAGYYGLPIASLERGKKSDPESVAKYISYYISYTFGKKSAPIIAKHHGAKHANSIHHGLKRARDLINSNVLIKNDVDFIIGLIKTA